MTTSNAYAKIGAVLGAVIATLTVAQGYFNTGGVLPALTSLGTVTTAITFAWGIFHAANSGPSK